MKYTKKPCRVVTLDEVKWKWVAAVIPYYYGKNRTGSQIHYIDGNYELVYTRCERVLERWMEYHHTSLAAVQKLAKELAKDDAKRRLVLVVHENLCLLPLKCREEAGRNTGTLGYVSMHAIAYAVEVEPYGTMLFFHEKHKGLLIPQRKETVELQMSRGANSLARYVEKNQKQKEQEEQLQARKRSIRRKKTEP